MAKTGEGGRGDAAQKTSKEGAVEMPKSATPRDVARAALLSAALSVGELTELGDHVGAIQLVRALTSELLDCEGLDFDARHSLEAALEEIDAAERAQEENGPPGDDEDDRDEDDAPASDPNAN